MVKQKAAIEQKNERRRQSIEGMRAEIQDEEVLKKTTNTNNVGAG